MTDNAYTPRPGTAVSLATQALLDGPMTLIQLAKVMNCDAGSVSARLHTALSNNFVRRLKDETGQVHYALTGMVVDERFRPYEQAAQANGTSRNALGRVLDDTPLVRSTTKTPKVSPEALAAANLFSRRPPPDANVVDTAPASTTVGERPAAEHQDKPTRKPRKVLAPVAAPPAMPPAEPFMTGLMSSGELLIAVGGKSLSLCTAHRHQLHAYLDKVKALV